MYIISFEYDYCLFSVSIIELNKFAKRIAASLADAADDAS